MSETPQEYNEPTAPDPEQELERPAYSDAGNGELNPPEDPSTTDDEATRKELGTDD
jgi:hypothetical protein